MPLTCKGAHVLKEAQVDKQPVSFAAFIFGLCGRAPCHSKVLTRRARGMFRCSLKITSNGNSLVSQNKCAG